MANLRYFLRLTLAFLKRFKGLILVSVAIGALLASTLFYILPRFFSATTETIGITGRYQAEDLPISILKTLSSGLTKLDDSGVPEPDIAQSWETPDNGKTWTFHLKDGITWQDGLPITSENIVYEFNDVEVDKPDPKTITFKLEDPFTPFPVVVSRPTFRKGLLGTKNWQVDQVAIASGFIQKLSISNDGGDKKIYKFYPTLEQTKLAFKLGKVDKIVNMLEATPFDSWQTADVEAADDEEQVVTLFFNTQDDHLSDKSLRQALTYAIDKDVLGARAISPISPNSWAYNPQTKPYTYDPERARQLFSDLDKEFVSGLKIEIVSTPILLPVAEKISSAWKDMGVDSSVLVSSIIPTEFQVYLTIFDIPKDPDQYAIWHSTQTATNLSKYSSPRIDKLLEDGRTTIETEERKKLYLDFQRFLSEDLPAAFLYHPTYYTISRK